VEVDEAIRSRKSVRKFLPKLVEQERVRHILKTAARSPSGNNIQPWKVHVVTGSPKDKLSKEILDAFDAGDDRCQPEYNYYPLEWFEPFQGRRRRSGYGLYEALGIGRDEKEKRHAQMRRNFTFFDAPVGLIVTLNRHLEAGSYMDTGMFIQSIMTSARGQGLHTCTQAAFAWYHDIIREHFPVGTDEVVLCGIALGYEDPDAPENKFITEREDVENFATFHGFS